MDRNKVWAERKAKMRKYDELRSGGYSAEAAAIKLGMLNPHQYSGWRYELKKYEAKHGPVVEGPDSEVIMHKSKSKPRKKKLGKALKKQLDTKQADEQTVQNVQEENKVIVFMGTTENVLHILRSL